MPRIDLTAPQSEIFLSPARFRVVCAGRRFGKTFLAVAWLLQGALEAQGKTAWYVAPTYRQAKEIAWKVLKRHLPMAWVRKINETDLSVEFTNGSVVALRGADNPDSLRGVSLSRVVLDEFATMQAEAWFEVLRPSLSDQQGPALFIGTPAGYNHFYDLWSAAHDRPGWAAWQFTTADGGNVPLAEIEAARAELDHRTFRQEYMASFETLSGRVYQAFDRLVNMRPDLEDHGGDLLVGMDFNVDPMSAVIGVRAGDQLHILHELEIPNGNTEIMAQEIRRRWPGRRVIVFPDPSGQGRRTAAPVGVTDHVLLRQAGFQVVAPPSAPAVVDRINETNALFKAADGTVRCYVHTRCTRLMRCLDGLTYKEGTSLPDKGLGLDHLPDALGYLIHSEFPIINNRPAFHAFRI